LEFQQQIKIKPIRPPAHAPDKIIAPTAQIVADLAVTHPFEGSEIYVVDPCLMHKPTE
jgi:hypothetical protein